MRPSKKAGEVNSGSAAMMQSNIDPNFLAIDMINQQVNQSVAVLPIQFAFPPPATGEIQHKPAQNRNQTEYRKDA
jgi:hypothetical protein